MGMWEVRHPDHQPQREGTPSPRPGHALSGRRVSPSFAIEMWQLRVAGSGASTTGADPVGCHPHLHGFGGAIQQALEWMCDGYFGVSSSPLGICDGMQAMGYLLGPPSSRATWVTREGLGCLQSGAIS